MSARAAALLARPTGLLTAVSVPTSPGVGPQVRCSLRDMTWGVLQLDHLEVAQPDIELAPDGAPVLAISLSRVPSPEWAIAFTSACPATCDPEVTQQ